MRQVEEGVGNGGLYAFFFQVLLVPGFEFDIAPRPNRTSNTKQRPSLPFPVENSQLVGRFSRQHTSSFVVALFTPVLHTGSYLGTISSPRASLLGPFDLSGRLHDNLYRLALLVVRVLRCCCAFVIVVLLCTVTSTIHSLTV